MPDTGIAILVILALIAVIAIITGTYIHIHRSSRAASLKRAEEDDEMQKEKLEEKATQRKEEALTQRLNLWNNIKSQSSPYKGSTGNIFYALQVDRPMKMSPPFNMRGVQPGEWLVLDEEHEFIFVVDNKTFKEVYTSTSSTTRLPSDHYYEWVDYPKGGDIEGKWWPYSELCEDGDNNRIVLCVAGPDMENITAAKEAIDKLLIEP